MRNSNPANSCIVPYQSGRGRRHGANLQTPASLDKGDVAMPPEGVAGTP